MFWPSPERSPDTIPALRPRDALDHREHHPSHRGILAHGIESGICPAEHDHFPNHSPLAHAQSTGQVKLLFGDLGHNVDHAGNKKHGDTEHKEAYFQPVPTSKNHSEEESEPHHTKKPALGNRVRDRLERGNNRQIGKPE